MVMRGGWTGRFPRWHQSKNMFITCAQHPPAARNQPSVPELASHVEGSRLEQTRTRPGQGPGASAHVWCCGSRKRLVPRQRPS
eukprot:1082597-Rhodomonas_salina.2